jgi:hypothetical protein
MMTAGLGETDLVTRRRIRVHGEQRPEPDLNKLAQALLQAAQDQQASRNRQEGVTSGQDDGGREATTQD